MRSRSSGFTILELMMSIGIIAVAILAVLAVFTAVLRGSNKSVSLSSGAAIAESKLNEEIYSVLNDDTARLNFFNSTTGLWLSGTDQTLNGTTYHYAIYVEDIAPSGAPLLVTPNRLKKADITVWWWNDSNVNSSGEVRDGYGVLRTQMTRLINERSRR